MKIVLTGGIASGKTAVTEELKWRGFFVVDADIVAREVVAPGTVGAAQVLEAFGESFFNNGVLNRRKLSEYVFKDPMRVARLNAILHPMIFERLQSLCDEKKGDVVAAIPLYFDTPYRLERIDAVWTVSADPDTRIKRLISRDNITTEHARQLLSAQLSDDERERLSDRIIRNDGTHDDLCREIERAVRGV